MSTHLHDPDAVLDYIYDWSDWMQPGEEIATHTIVTGSGLTVDSSSASDTTVTVWVSGAVTGTRILTCRITTNQGRIDDRSHVLVVQER